MFSLKRYGFLYFKNLIGYTHDHYDYMKQVKQYLYILNAYHINYTKDNETHLCIALCSNKDRYNRKDDSDVQNKVFFSRMSIFNKRFCTEVQPKDSNKFGDLSYEKYERVPMDEAEKKEEKISDYVKIPKWQKYTYYDYCQLLKFHINNKDLQLALNVLDLMKENGENPSKYMYKLLISAHAMQGDITQCFHLFRSMKQKGLIPGLSIYNSLINACAETTSSKKALERLTYLREYFHERNVVLNKFHYTTLIKAYARHKQILTAFEIADEAKDKGIYTAAIFAALFHATISDKETGLKHALILWHKMKISKVKPQIIHYNLLLKAIKDTKFGNLKTNDILIPGSMETQIQINEIARPNLLNSPPILNNSLISVLKYYNTNTFNTSNLCKKDDENLSLSENLDNILCANRLILFGGLDKILKQMEDEGVTPNMKTFTLLLELLPPTIEAEKYFLKYLKENHFTPDPTFFNILIRRRSQRRNYEDAKAVLNEFQIYRLTPNINTFEALALGCTSQRAGIELLEQINAIGYATDSLVLEKLLYNACCNKNLDYVSYLMDYILKHQIVPSQKMLDILEKLDTLLLQVAANKGKYEGSYAIRKNYNRFKICYENWKKMIQRKEI